MTLVAVAVTGACGAIAGYIAEEHGVPVDPMPRRLIRVAIRALALGAISGVVLHGLLFTDVTGGELLADLGSGYLCGDLTAIVLRRQEELDQKREPLVETAGQGLVGGIALLLGAAATLAL